MKIQSALERFCEYSRYIKGYSEPTIRRYKQAVRQYSTFAGIDELEQVKDEDIREFFYNGRRVRNWSANSFICYHKSLVVFFRWCVNEKLLEHNPADDIEVPKLEKRLPPKLTKQQAVRLLEVVYNYPYGYGFLRHRNRAIFATFLYAGLRKKELVNLNLTDVDLDNMSIFIRQGKGNKDRVIPMCSKLAEIMRDYLSERYRLGKTCPEFFCSLNRNMGIQEIGLKRLVEKMREASGIHFTIHKLRHTFATLMLEGGCDVFSLSKMMGHSDIKTTTIYLAATPEHLRGQIIKHPLN